MTASATVRRQDPRLALRGIRKAFGGITALDGVDFAVRPGEIHALLGENGAGKTTLVKIIAGAYAPDAGTIEVDGEEYAHLSPELSRGLGIAVVHQEFNLLPDLTVAENILLGNQPRGRLGMISVRRSAQRAAKILADLGARLNPYRLVRHLTVAEQQMVEIARAMALDAGVVVMDEPSAALDTDEVEVLFQVLRRLRSQGRSVVYISHRLEETFAIADRATVLKDGRSTGTRHVPETTRDEVIRLMIGRPLAEQFPQRRARIDRPILEVRGLTVPGKVFDVSFRVRAGEVVGFAGLGGSGRTTIARALVGLERRGPGTVLLDGAAAPADPAAAAEAGLVMVPEDRKAHGIVAGQSVEFNISLASLRELSRWRFVAARRERELVARSIQRLGVRPPIPEMEVQNLSGGNQQKVVLARWLVRRPKAVVLDEPTRGVDIGAKAEIYKTIEQLSEDGVGVVMTSSELPELLGTCDRIVVLHEGRVNGELTRSDATEEAIIRYATGDPTSAMTP